MTIAHTPPARSQEERETSLLVCLSIAFFVATPVIAYAQVADPTGIKRCFLDRYLDCAEAPSDAARLYCYDALLLDIPAWLEGLPKVRTDNGSFGSTLPRPFRNGAKEQCIPEGQE